MFGIGSNSWTRERLSPPSLHAVLDERADSMPENLALRFLTDGETREDTATYSSLADHARRCAGGLMDRGLGGKPVLLALPPGLDFIGALFGCWQAGVIAVPAYPPTGTRHRERLKAVIADCKASHAIVSTTCRPIQGISSLDIADLSESRPYDRSAVYQQNTPCLLQYTSGSTADPKGAMISHENLRAHFKSLSCYGDLQLQSVLSWLPPYHDMGLVLKILYAIEAGIPLTFFSPDHFIQRPARWLKAISRFRAEMSGAPNFAYDACVRSCTEEEIAELDLSSWKVAPCGAERIRPDTLERFAARFASCGFNKSAFRPGYGLAETTLIVTARQFVDRPLVTRHPEAGEVVSCGSPLPGNRVRIVNTENGESLPDWKIGEIRVSGPIVSKGYWNRGQESTEVSEDLELHTGDLGFLANGELHVTGRIKDLIIIDGVNHSPEDIENSLLTALRPVIAAVAFPVEESGRETVGIAMETRGPATHESQSLCAMAREIIEERHGLSPSVIRLIRPGLLPRTTSGKIQRHRCAALFRENAKGSIADTTRSGVDRLRTEDVLEIAATIVGIQDLGPDDDLVELGVGSLDMTRLSARIRARFGVHVSVADLFAAGSFTGITALIGESGRDFTKLPLHHPSDDSTSPILTHAQERMWFLHQMDPGSAAYHVFGSVELTGALDKARLHRAYQELVGRHDILTSRHGTDCGIPAVRLLPDVSVGIEEAAVADDADARMVLRAFARRPFDLASDVPIRAILLKTTDARHILAITAHHIVADGWSMNLLARELAVLYSGGSPKGQAPSYLNYARSHRQWIRSGAVNSQIDYWRCRLTGHSGVSALPTDFPRPAKPSPDGEFVSVPMPPDLAKSVVELAKRRRTTPFTIHLAVLMLLLRQHGGGNDLVTAIPVANRNHDETTDLVGTLVNTLPFRMELQSDEEFLSLLDRTRAAAFEMIENQDAPFEMIIDAIKPERASDHSPIAQVMFDHQEIPLEQSWAEGVTCKPFHAHRGAAQFDLSLLLTSYGQYQQLGIEYRTDLFRESTITALLERYLEILKRICTNPEQTVRVLTSLAKPDKAWLNAISIGPFRPDYLGQTPLELIHRRMTEHPERAAILTSGEALSYGELNRRSSNLAQFLGKAGVAKGDRVAILLERTHLLPVAVLALWKLGAAYVPLDGSNPEERLRMTLSDQGAIRVLASGSLAHLIPPGFSEIRIEDHDLTSSGSMRFEMPAAGDPAYLIYTSGSTGRPKGVTISHQALANLLLSMSEAPGFTAADRILAVTTLSFDISCLELFLPLIAGGSVFIASSDDVRDGRRLVRLLGESGASVMQATPATWRMMIESGWQGSPSLKILCGGEALGLPLARSLVRMGCQLWNLYGPTETTVWSTCWRVPDNPNHVRIGGPIANTGIHILSEEGDPLPPGAIGHLWISGCGLAEGYWARQELTSERFRLIQEPGGSSVRAYQTGDLARWNADGTLECLGRKDGQVKIRGFRVELGEIEAVLNEHPQIETAKVALRGGGDQEGKLVAWIKPKCGQGPDWNSLRQHLSNRLPGYMIPADIAEIDDFPLTSSGKVDTQHLPDPSPVVTPVSGPLTESEQRMIELWRELLGRPSVTLDDDWFQIGGHSLLSLRLFARIHQETGRNLPLSAILEHSSPRRLAALIDRQAPTLP